MMISFAKAGKSHPMIQRENPRKPKFLAALLWEIQNPISRVAVRKTIVRHAVSMAECGLIL